jgi:RES domain
MEGISSGYPSGRPGLTIGLSWKLVRLRRNASSPHLVRCAGVTMDQGKPNRRKRSRLTQFLLDAARERFYGCEACSGSDAFDLIDDAIAPLRLKGRESKRLFRSLTCPWCESWVGSGMLVAVATPEQLRQTRLSKKFDALYGAEVEDFRKFLIKYPMLGAEHPFGKVLSKAITRAGKTVVEPSVWYHATRYSDAPNFGPRPQGKAIKANRYNQIGQVGWYLASDEKTAGVEQLRTLEFGKPVCIARIRLLERIVVLDLRSCIWGEDPARQWILRNVVDKRFISQPASDVADTRPEYRVPQFVADLARRRKFRGILYDSARPSPHNNPEAVGQNLVVFDPVPAYAVESESAVEFHEPDYDPFGAERFVLKGLQGTQ